MIKSPPKWRDFIVINHLQAECLALATIYIYYSLDFPDSIAIKYSAYSQCRHEERAFPRASQGRFRLNDRLKV